MSEPITYIVLLSIICKLFEKSLLNKMIAFIVKNKILNFNQFGCNKSKNNTQYLK